MEYIICMKMCYYIMQTSEKRERTKTPTMKTVKLVFYIYSVDDHATIKIRFMKTSYNIEECFEYNRI